MHNDAPRDPRALLDGWRDSGADRADPVRFRFIEALARRASAYDGEARRRLEQRLAGLVADFGDGLSRVQVEAPASGAPLQRPDTRSDLAAVTARLGQAAHPDAHPDAHSDANPEANPASHPAALPAPQAPRTPHTSAAANERLARHAEPALADYFRDTWARVSVDRQLRDSQAGVPENAGPLNTNHLVHRSLSLMREVSPGYLEQFLSYVDALSWLEGMHAISLVPDRETPRAPAPRKARARSPKAGSGTA
ncbi:DUF2894 domain-containing protein [Cupriavidus pauculus]|uniref:DUF2894 domain-containing protein n=1 Tax=Cupriavidus pauculus TaxID=82633 RepID=A0A2N5CCR3_9BURK|nr:DUF2894 domain-containing protein [Cupriavidus pauculus]PLQ00043.1 DUF2894 domain-containing protein [Cupriavidus pauculus]